MRSTIRNLPPNAALALLALLLAAHARADSIQVLHSLVQSSEGGLPIGGLTLVGSTLYGTATSGGSLSSANGTAFSLNVDGSNFQVLHQFVESTGAFPYGTMLNVGSKLIGTASAGGRPSSGQGAIFSMNLDGTSYQVLHAFTGSDGSDPYAGVSLVGSKLFGTSWNGGIGNGTAYSMNLDGSNFQLLHTFSGNDGGGLWSGLMAVGSTLFGTASGGGANHDGTIYSMNMDGSNFQVVHAFTGGVGGQSPYGQMIAIGSTLYGTTQDGGASGVGGTIFSMNVDGTGFQILHSFAFPGNNPYAGLTLVGSTLFGTTTGVDNQPGGTLFSMNLDGSNYQTLDTFSGGSSGENPYSGLTLGASALYGTTHLGGAGNGMIFSIAVVPEPSGVILAALGLVALVARGSRRRQR